MNRQAEQDRAAPKVGILLDTFPNLSETNVLGEIHGLERLGLRLNLYALHRPAGEAPPEAVKNLQDRVRYLPRQGRVPTPASGFDQLRLLRRSPARFRAALAFIRERQESGRWRDWSQACWLACRLLDAGISHLHSLRIDRTGAIAELVARLTGISFSVAAASRDIYRADESILRRKLQSASFCVTGTGYNRDHLLRIGGDQAQVHRQYHGVNLNRLRPANEAPPAPGKAPLLLSVGRYEERKGFITLIDACATLLARGRNFRCQIIGQGPEHLRLQRRIDELGVSRYVQLVEPLPQEQVIDRYRQADMFVLPALIARDGDRDDIPEGLLEAMAMELPVVSTRVSGIPEVLGHEQTGLMVQPENHRELADALDRLLRDAGLGERLGRNARDFVAEFFSPEANLKPLAALLRQWAAAPHQPARSTTAASAGQPQRSYA